MWRRWKNTLEQSATGITLTFTLKDSSGQTVSEQSAPALLNLLAAGKQLPVNAYFNPVIPSGYQVQVALKTALPVEEGSALSEPVEIKVNSIDPKRARSNGQRGHPGPKSRQWRAKRLVGFDHV